MTRVLAVVAGSLVASTVVCHGLEPSVTERGAVFVAFVAVGAICAAVWDRELT